MSSIRSISLIFLILALNGCSKLSPPSPHALSEANQKFLKIYKEEFEEDIILKEVNKTLWIYMPLEGNIVETKASSQMEEDTKGPVTKPTVRFIDGSFKNETFHIQYDIAPNKIYTKSYGYASSYSESYQKEQRRIFSAFQRSYMEVDSPPEFLVYIIADTNNGLESENILYFNDIKEAMAVSQEEYLKRAVSELRGGMAIINDTKGRHLKYDEITLPDFLIKQIINRVNFKYQRSSFPPSADTPAEIKTILKETFKAYNFKNFQSVELEDLNSGAKTTILRTELD